MATAQSPYTGSRVNRFLHIATSRADLVMQNKMQRRLGQLTDTCFQRCVGMDAMNMLHSVTFEMDVQAGTGYHRRFFDFLSLVQKSNLVVGGAMTDVEGDRGRAPSEQEDPDLFDKTWGFAGPIAAVNPRYDDVDGMPCFPSVAAVPHPVGLAVIAVLSKSIDGVLKDCEATGVRGVQIISSGFAEQGGEGAEQQDCSLSGHGARGFRLSDQTVSVCSVRRTRSWRCPWTSSP